MTLAEVLVHTNKENLEFRSQITGEVYFSIRSKNFFFPEENWNDFIVIVLTWWHNSLIRIKHSKSKVTEELLFMDGSFVVKVTKTNDEIATLAFIHESLSSLEIEHTCTVNISQMIESLLQSTNELLEVIHQNRWYSEEIEELEKAYEILKG